MREIAIESLDADGNAQEACGGQSRQQVVLRQEVVRARGNHEAGGQLLPHKRLANLLGAPAAGGEIVVRQVNYPGIAPGDEFPNLAGHSVRRMVAPTPAVETDRLAEGTRMRAATARLHEMDGIGALRHQVTCRQRQRIQGLD